VVGLLGDLLRSRRALVAENALLRQLIVLRRRTTRPRFTSRDRLLLVLLARRVRAWRQALLIVQPETLLRWHRAGFRLLWRRRSRAPRRTRQLDLDVVALIQQLARENRLWGAERIRGELLKLGVRVCKRTVQKYMRQVRPPRRRRGQTWAAFLRNHGKHIWACDFLQTYDLFFRPVFAFFLIELASRRVVHVGVTRQPTDAWVAQQLREATPFGQHPKHLVCDNDAKFGPTFTRVAAVSGIEEVRIAYRAPRMNAIAERFLGSVRRECLDHVIILGDRHLEGILKEYTGYFNRERPHQGLGQALPEPEASPGCGVLPLRVRSESILGGLHHAYHCAA
jgi:transposase InsO family protein